MLFLLVTGLAALGLSSGFQNYSAQCAKTTGNPNWDNASPKCDQPNFGSICGVYGTGSCCSSAFTSNFSASPSYAYPAWTYDQCPTIKALSPQCTRFHQYQECSYACDGNPRTSSTYSVLYNLSTTDSSRAIPLCASYCDEWYASCADDYTCFGDWSNWPVDANGGYSCPAGAQGTCRKYSEVFGSAQGLCTKLWSPRAYSYSTDLNTCLSLGPSLKGACFPGLPNPPLAASTCSVPMPQPSPTRSDGASSCAASAAASILPSLAAAAVALAAAFWTGSA